MKATVLAWTAWLGAAAAEGQGPLKLEDVLQSVREHLPQVLAAQEDSTAARARLTSARGAFDPVVRARGGTTPIGEYANTTLDTWVEQPTPILGTSFFGGWRMGLGEFAPYDGKAATNGLGEVRGGVRVPLGRNLLLDSRRAGLERAHLDVTAQDVVARQALLEGSAAGGSAFLQWVAAGQRLKVADELLELAVVRDVALRARVAGGEIPAVEAVENERAILSRRSNVVTARRGLEQAALVLGLYFRTDDGQPRVVGADRMPADVPLVHEPIPSVEDGVALALAQRPETYRQRLAEAAARVDVRLAQNDLLPGVDLMVQGSQDLGAGKVSRATPELQAMLTVEMPLPNRGGLGRVEAQQAALRKVRHQGRWVEDRVRNDVADAVSAWRNARERVVVTLREVEVARALETAEWRRFDHGDSTLLFVNLRETATAEARVRVVEAHLEEARAHLMWKVATGALLPEARS